MNLSSDLMHSLANTPASRRTQLVAIFAAHDLLVLPSGLGLGVTLRTDAANQIWCGLTHAHWQGLTTKNQWEDAKYRRTFTQDTRIVWDVRFIHVWWYLTMILRI